MAVTQLDGGRQIKSATITDTQIAASANIALSKLAEAVLQADGGQAWTGNQDAGTFRLTNLQDPSSAQDAATRAWVLAQIGGISTSGITARAATTANITLSGTQTVDSVALSAGNIVLVKNQTTQSENGVYTVAAGAWTRVPGMDTWAEVPGTLVSVQEGGQADTLWLSTADTGGTLGTTAITFMQLPGPSDLLAGAGLTRTGQTIDVVAADSSLTVGANSVGVQLAANGGLELNTGLQVNTDDSSIEKDGSGNLRVKAGGVTNAMLATTYIQQANYVVRETPSGSVNGSNTTFTLASTPVAGTEMVFLNGILQEPGAGNDYTISGGTITYLAAPLTGDKLRVTYLK